MKFNRMSFNQLKGRVTGEPEHKETKNGKKLLSFRLAYNTPQTTDADGSHVNFIQVEAWEKLAELFTPLLVNGLQIIVHGDLVQNRWKNKEDQPRSTFRFSADSISIIDENFAAVKDAA